MNGKRALCHYSVVFALVLFCSILMIWPAIVPGPTRHRQALSSGILINLRQLNAAKQTWALEHGITGNVMVAKENVMPYLRGWVIRAGEEYTLNSLSQAPQARMTREVGGWPRGTIVWVGTNGGLEVMLPTNGASSAK